MVEFDTGGQTEGSGVNPQNSYRAKAGFVYTDDGRQLVLCEEPTCQFFEGRFDCTNPNQLINDECLGDQWCMSYEPKKER